MIIDVGNKGRESYGVLKLMLTCVVIKRSN